MKIAVLALTKGGIALAEKIATTAKNCTHLPNDTGIAATLKENWLQFDAFICIMAAGIVVRAIAPLLGDKRSDPCVLVLDENGRHVISLLSGHIGGGNQLAHEIARLIGGTAVITTASDTVGLVPLDLWIREQNLVAAEKEVLTRTSALLVNKGFLTLYCETAVDSLPRGIRLTEEAAAADLVISNRETGTNAPVFYPRNLVVGIGCNRGTPALEFEEAITELFLKLQLSLHSIRNLSSIDVKNDEPGLLQFALKRNLPIEFFSREQINTMTNVAVSDAALKAVGAIGVAEPTALLSAKTTTLLSRKRKWHNITMAVAEAPFTLSAQVQALLNI